MKYDKRPVIIDIPFYGIYNIITKLRKGKKPMKHFKKILAIALALTMLLAFASPSFAADSSCKSITFLKDFVTTRTLGAALDDSAFSSSGIPVSNVNVKIKLEGENNVKLFGSADLGPIKDIKVILDNGKLMGYISIFKINIGDIVSDLTGQSFNFDFGAVAEQINPILDKLDSETLDLLALKETKNVTLADYGEVQAEILTVSSDKIAGKIAAAAAESGNPVDVTGKTVDELIELAAQLNISDLNYYIALYRISQSEDGLASFYYKDGKLVGVKINFINEETQESMSFDTSTFGLKFKSIETNLPDSAFSAPKIALNISGLVKFILKFFIR